MSKTLLRNLTILLLLHTPGCGATTDLKVMSFNIRYGTANDGENSWDNRKDFAVDVIEAEDADIIGTQEALRFQLEYIKESLPGYGEIGVGRDDGREAGEYSAILYRLERFDIAESGTFWFSDTPEVPGSASWGNSITRICTWARLTDRETGAHLYVYNLHLDHQSQASRERSVELLAGRIHGRGHPDPVIVTGDFNSGESNPAIRYLKGEISRASGGSGQVAGSPRLIDSFRALHPYATGAGTFNDFRGDTSGEKIDYVLVDRRWEVLEAGIITTARDGRYPSDHFPVSAVLRISEGY